MEDRAFKSTAPDVLRIHAESVAAHDEWQAKVLAEQERLGSGVVVTYGGFRRQIEVLGIEAKHEERGPDDPRWKRMPFLPAPDGWVKYDKYDYYVPKRGKAGEPARQWLKDMRPPPSFDSRMTEFYDGHPMMVDGEMHRGWPDHTTTPARDFSYRLHWPVYFAWDDALWIKYRGTLGFGDEDEESDHLEKLLAPHFEPAPLSEWYAAAEAFEAVSKEEKDGNPALSH